MAKQLSEFAKISDPLACGRRDFLGFLRVILHELNKLVEVAQVLLQRKVVLVRFLRATNSAADASGADCSGGDFRGDFRDIGGCSRERMCGEGEHRFVLRNLYTVLDLL